MKAYLKWGKENGAIFDKVDYPAVFNGICGARAKEDIAPGEAFVFIPNKLIISVESARQSEIGDIFKSHETLFVSNVDRDYLILLVFTLYERVTKGEDSFWHPYFDAVEPGRYASLMDQDIIDLCDEPELKLNLKLNKDKL